MSPVKYELGFYIPEDDILHSHRRENLKSYNLDFALTEVEEALREQFTWMSAPIDLKSRRIRRVLCRMTLKVETLGYSENNLRDNGTPHWNGDCACHTGM
jgi:hypothetical protein